MSCSCSLDLISLWVLKWTLDKLVPYLYAVAALRGGGEGGHFVPNDVGHKQWVHRHQENCSLKWPWQSALAVRITINRRSRCRYWRIKSSACSPSVYLGRGWEEVIIVLNNINLADASIPLISLCVGSVDPNMFGIWHLKTKFRLMSVWGPFNQRFTLCFFEYFSNGPNYDVKSNSNSQEKTKIRRK